MQDLVIRLKAKLRVPLASPQHQFHGSKKRRVREAASRVLTMARVGPGVGVIG